MFSDDYLPVGVETYGGGIWHSWFDRDLSLAGRVVVASGSSSTGSGGEGHSIGSHKYNSRLIRIKQPILRVPTLAIHLDRAVNESFKFNNETEFIPVLGLLSSQLNGDTPKEKQDADPAVSASSSTVAEHHHPALLELIAQEMSVAPEEIQDFEL